MSQCRQSDMGTPLAPEIRYAICSGRQGFRLTSAENETWNHFLSRSPDPSSARSQTEPFLGILSMNSLVVDPRRTHSRVPLGDGCGRLHAAGAIRRPELGTARRAERRGAGAAPLCLRPETRIVGSIW